MVSLLVATIDVFNTRASFVHKNRSKYSSLLGGACSLILFALLVVYLVFLISDPVKLTAKDTETINNYNEYTTYNGNSTTTTDINWTKVVDYKLIEKHHEKTEDQEVNSILDAGYYFAVAPHWLSFDPSYVSFEFYVATVDPTNGYLYFYMPPVACDETNFGIDNMTRADNQDITTDALCPYYEDTTIEFIGDLKSSTRSFVEFDIYKCSTDCESDEDMAYFVYGTYIDIHTLNSHYDAETRSIQSALRFNDEIYITYNNWNDGKVLINSQDVKFLNGTTKRIYSTDRIVSNTQYYESSTIVRVRFVLSEKHTVIQEYEYWQPTNVVESRMLDSSESTNTTTEKSNESDSPVYQTLFVMAQIGGLYSFLKMIIGTIISPILRRLQELDLINTLALKRYKSKQKMRDLNMSQGHGSSKIAPMNLEEEAKISGVNTVDKIASIHKRSRLSKVADRTLEEHPQMFGVKDALKGCCKRIFKHSSSTQVQYISNLNRTEQYQQEREKLLKSMEVTEILNDIKSLKDLVQNIVESVNELKQKQQDIETTAAKEAASHLPQSLLDHFGINSKNIGSKRDEINSINKIVSEVMLEYQDDQEAAPDSKKKERRIKKNHDDTYDIDSMLNIDDTKSLFKK